MSDVVAEQMLIEALLELVVSFFRGIYDFFFGVSR
jgi:hypothetical protein